MTSQSFVCDICGEDNAGLPSSECCGLKYCVECEMRTEGRCYVCKKDELNVALQCDMCGTVGNGFTIQMCSKPDGNCDMFVCKSCNKAGDPEDTFRYCSFRHFQDMLEDLFTET